MMNMGSRGAKEWNAQHQIFIMDPLLVQKIFWHCDTTVVSQMHMGSTGIGSKRVKPSNKGTMLAGAQFGVGDNPV